ncbi:MAG: hypothetical protein SFZ03_11050 [Candidatus Melainabacteria bacterium]|nr:hypothetical protein [Candidatus Melainabacteria bacterium]
MLPSLPEHCVHRPRDSQSVSGLRGNTQQRPLLGVGIVRMSTAIASGFGWKFAKFNKTDLTAAQDPSVE